MILMFLLAVLVSLFHFEHLVGNVSLIDADIARKCEYARIASIGLVVYWETMHICGPSL